MLPDDDSNVSSTTDHGDGVPSATCHQASAEPRLFALWGPNDDEGPPSCNALKTAFGDRSFDCAAPGFTEDFLNSPGTANPVDSAELVYFHGHGYPGELCTKRKHPERAPTMGSSAQSGACRWGTDRLRWVMLDACATLACAGSADPTPFKNWRGAFQGLRMILGWNALATPVPTRGKELGDDLEFKTLWEAWKESAEEDSESSEGTYLACLFAEVDGEPSPLFDKWTAKPASSVKTPTRFVWYGYDRFQQEAYP